MKIKNVSFVGGVIVLTIFLLCVWGYVANAFKFIGMLDGDVTAMFIGRIVGMIIVPLGVILGFC